MIYYYMGQEVSQRGLVPVWSASLLLGMGAMTPGMGVVGETGYASGMDGQREIDLTSFCGGYVTIGTWTLHCLGLVWLAMGGNK